MKTVVSLQDLLEYEIRPRALLAEYHRLTEAAVRAWPVDSFNEVACPGCGGEAAHTAFERFGLTYKECGTCATVYLSPRPDAGTLAGHARSSDAARFWRERILPETEGARREKILQPRSDWIRDAIAEYAPGATSVLDLSPYELPDDGGPVHAITAFEVVDRAPDVPALVAAARRALRPGGLLFVTAPSITGFELQVLWDRAVTIAPPEKINLLSIRGFIALFRAGWEIVELSTPGMFDVETVRRAVDAAPAAQWPRFVRTLVSETDAQRRMEFQEYLQRARLASFARLIVRRTG
jgi:SAM-dependent methyltransferase